MATGEHIHLGQAKNILGNNFRSNDYSNIHRLSVPKNFGFSDWDMRFTSMLERHGENTHLNDSIKYLLSLTNHAIEGDAKLDLPFKFKGNEGHFFLGVMYRFNNFVKDPAFWSDLIQDNRQRLVEGVGTFFTMITDANLDLSSSPEAVMEMRSTVESLSKYNRDTGYDSLPHHLNVISSYADLYRVGNSHEQIAQQNKETGQPDITNLRNSLELAKQGTQAKLDMAATLHDEAEELRRQADEKLRTANELDLQVKNEDGLHRSAEEIILKMERKTIEHERKKKENETFRVELEKKYGGEAMVKILAREGGLFDFLLSEYKVKRQLDEPLNFKWNEENAEVFFTDFGEIGGNFVTILKAAYPDKAGDINALAQEMSRIWELRNSPWQQEEVAVLMGDLISQRLSGIVSRLNLNLGALTKEQIKARARLEDGQLDLSREIEILRNMGLYEATEASLILSSPEKITNPEDIREMIRTLADKFYRDGFKNKDDGLWLEFKKYFKRVVEDGESFNIDGQLFSPYWVLNHLNALPIEEISDSQKATMRSFATYTTANSRITEDSLNNLMNTYHRAFKDVPHDVKNRLPIYHLTDSQNPLFNDPQMREVVFRILQYQDLTTAQVFDGQKQNKIRDNYIKQAEFWGEAAEFYHQKAEQS